MKDYRQECRLLKEDINEQLAEDKKGMDAAEECKLKRIQRLLQAESDMDLHLGHQLHLSWKIMIGSTGQILWVLSHLKEDEEEVKRKITRPRPGHADLNGALNMGTVICEMY